MRRALSSIATRITVSASACPVIAPIMPNACIPTSTTGTVTSSRQKKMRKRYFVCPSARSVPSSGSEANGVIRIAMRKIGTLAS